MKRIAPIAYMLLGAGCAGIAQQIPPAVAKVCSVYENPLVQIGITAGLSAFPGAEVVKLAVDPWVIPICNGTASAALMDPTTPDFIMQQVTKIQKGAIRAPVRLSRGSTMIGVTVSNTVGNAVEQ